MEEDLPDFTNRFIVLCSDLAAMKHSLELLLSELEALEESLEDLGSDIVDSAEVDTTDIAHTI
jgi:hypothetical protein